MVEIVRCARPTVARPQCSEDGCERSATKRGRCNPCYQRWYDSPDFEYAPAPPPYVPPPDPVCAWCGPYPLTPGASHSICPTCGLTPGEVAYTERILADSTAVWIEENRAFQADRKGGRA